VSEPQAAQGGERRLISVDGIDGSGKSTVARRLAAALGQSAVLLGGDEFRRPVDWAAGGRSELDVYYDDRYDLGALDGCLRSFLAGGGGCRLPVFDSSKEQLTGDREVDFTGKRWAVVEGVFVARVPVLAAAPAEALTIFVDLPRALADQRIQARDEAAGRPLAEVRRRIAQRYFPSHDRYLAECDPRTRARIVIDTSEPQRPVLTREAWPEDPAWLPVRAVLPAVLKGSEVR
jgi:uridine kinase